MSEAAPGDQGSTPLARREVSVEKRLLLFGLLGPLIGWVVLTLLLTRAAQSSTSVLDMFKITSGFLPFVYPIGLVPALLTGLADARFAARQMKWRPVWTAIAGSFATVLVLIPGWAIGLLLSPGALWFCVLGTISGFVCALLCVDPKRR